MKTCYIFGAAEGLPKSLTPHTDDLVIAADKGFLYTEKLNITPDIILGDFDSLGFIPKGKEIITHPIRKDDTDTMLAIKTGLLRGYTNFVLFGCAGKRLDHTIANIQSLSFIAENGGMGFLQGDSFTAAVIKNNTLSFSEKSKGSISVFALTEECKGVTLKGLSYELENATITNSFPLGVSNEFMGKKSSVIVENGTALIIWQGEIELCR